MSELLLIHGSCHGAWCWDDTLEALKALGQPARAIDLPSHGQDPTPPENVTLDSYAEAIVSAIESPVVLVGHSMGGFPITAAALLAPEKIRALVYLAAYIPAPGRTHAEMRADWPEQPLAEAIVPAGKAAIRFRDESLGPLFYHDCPPGTVQRAAAKLCAQPLAPSQTALPRNPNLPRHAILCTEDRVIPPGLQRRMAAELPRDRISQLATGHSPFYAAPEALAAQLAAIARAA